MGHRVASQFPAPSLYLAWHDEPYGDPADCWGCGHPTDLLSPTHHGLPQIPGRPPPRHPECTWCTELAAILDAEHQQRWKARGHAVPPRKPAQPPRGPSGISPTKDGSR